MDGLDCEQDKFLGENGNWERTAIEKDGDPLLYVDGWSFLNEHLLQSPLEEYHRSSPSDAPLIGLLHPDLDAPESEYTPVDSSALVDTPADAWLLGHIHKPEVHRSADPYVVYPGSPQPLDPGERGGHGPWIVTADSTGNVDAKQIPLASLPYERLEVDVCQAHDSKDVPAIVSDHISEQVRNFVITGPLDLLLSRVKLISRTSAHGTLVDERNSIEDQLSFKKGSLPVRGLFRKFWLTSLLKSLLETVL